MQPLPSAGDSHSQVNTNLSTTISFSVLDEHGNDIPIQTIDNQLIELIIPRDPNLILPLMIVQNMTKLDKYNQSFYFYSNNFTRKNNLTISFHFQMHPFNFNLSYLFIFNFDRAPVLNQLDGWNLFCPSGLISPPSVFVFFWRIFFI